MHVIPESWAHLHILVSLLPLVGLLFVLGFYVSSIVTNNDGLKRICLLVVVGLGVSSIPIYVSGMNSIMPVLEREGVSEDLINAHYNWSLYALLVLLVAAAPPATSGCGRHGSDGFPPTLCISSSASR